jgi:hypothetical protein
MEALMVASFALKAVGAISQNRHAQSAQNARLNLANQEREGALSSAKQTRESAEDVILDSQKKTIVQGEQVKSDAARLADVERASLVAIAGERGQLATTTFMRQQQALNYFHNIDQSRVNQSVNDSVLSLQKDKEQVVADQANVINNASLNYYSTSVDAKLAKARAKQQAFMQIASAAVSGGQKYISYKSGQSIASNKVE